jgi:amino acid transporter
MADDRVSNAPWSDKPKMVSESPIMEPQPQEQPTHAYDDVDYEKYGASRESNPLPELKRKLKSRHLQMIAIGEYNTHLEELRKISYTHTHACRV